ncbi:hypothetical protein MTO96_045918, partial [Rhipicephalus appendiculatus]
QQPGESIADFIVDLRRLSEHCEFGGSVEDMLHDRLVCGVHDEALQWRLLAETALNFKKAYKYAVAAEYATRQTAAIIGALPAAPDLHRMDQAPEGAQARRILGGDWFQPLRISLEGLHQLNEAPVSNSSRGEGQPAARDQSKVVTSVKMVLQDYSKVFKPGLGKSTSPPVRIEVDEQATPKFCKPWQAPFTLLPKIEEAFEQFVKQGIHVPDKNSSWPASIVPILKKNGKIRICRDYKGTLNPVVKWETYPLPTPEQLLARLWGCAVRLPLTAKNEHEPPLGDILLLEAAPEVPLDSTKIATLTRTDPVLPRVHRWILQGWPSGKVPEGFRPFVARKNQLYTYRNCVLWDRV